MDDQQPPCSTSSSWPAT
ncbi:hypothetical protein E2C01_063438 [Portunus trituberculatus]|uniref:Uncharacterized protein n=1 Tax=Portunus trituberculatus TaxID=210409 RepID=A0A5B7H952_PORTR|nr:hypothetical protein [Portunus trituberculatus]